MIPKQDSPYNQKPPEYISGKALFCGKEFFVDKNVLIPRIETEEIIDLVCHSGLDPESICDVGCGSGCIGITLSQKFPNATIYLSDISEKALEIAKKNSTKEVVIKSDLLRNYPKDLLFDVITANLPYIPSSRIPELPGSVKNFEPSLALDGGLDGATLINKLLSQLPAHLKPTGLAILEIDDTHNLKSFKIPPASPEAGQGRAKVFKAELKKDQFGRNRFLILHWTVRSR